MADDFADGFSTPVVHVGWWGSYHSNVTNGGVQQFLVSFLGDVPGGPAPSFSYPGTVLSSEIVSLGSLSPGSGTFTEALLSAHPGGEDLYRYNAELRSPFMEQPDTVYWLAITALVPSQSTTVWGWHDRDYTVHDTLASTSPNVMPGENDLGPFLNTYSVWHFQDDAVSGSLTLAPNMNLQLSLMAPQNYVDNLDGPVGISTYSKDLAFELYTVPEPATLGLVGMAGLLLCRRRRRA